jgi:hypothetical protein
MEEYIKIKFDNNKTEKPKARKKKKKKNQMRRHKGTKKR